MQIPQSTTNLTKNHWFLKNLFSNKKLLFEFSKGAFIDLFQKLT
jgi:hypothetical protein